MAQSNTQRLWKLKHYRDNKQTYLDKQQERRRKVKKFINDLKTPCIACDENDVACIDFHHIDPNEKEATVATAVTNKWGEKRILVEVAKCVCLCSNCHRKLHEYEWTVEETIAKIRV
jgi:predicted HNH restriction endonuclease